MTFDLTAYVESKVRHKHKARSEEEPGDEATCMCMHHCLVGRRPPNIHKQEHTKDIHHHVNVVLSIDMYIPCLSPVSWWCSCSYTSGINPSHYYKSRGRRT